MDIQLIEAVLPPKIENPLLQGIRWSTTARYSAGWACERHVDRVRLYRDDDADRVAVTL